jgi:hypothetical protein
VIFLLDRIDRDERAPEGERELAPETPVQVADAEPALTADGEPMLAAAAEPTADVPATGSVDVPPTEPPPGPGRLERARLAATGQLQAASYTIRHPVAVVRETLADPVAWRLRPVRRPRRHAAAVERRHVHRRRGAPGGVVALLPAPFRRWWSSRWSQASWRSRSSCGYDRARWPAPRRTRRSTGATSSTTRTCSNVARYLAFTFGRSSCWWPSRSSS